MAELHLLLPYPPSVNHYWRHSRGRHFISPAGVAFRAAVSAQLQAERHAGPITDRVHVDVLAHPPDRRRRDVDNVLKALLDAIVHGGVLADDSQIDRLSITRGEVVQGGACHVTVTAQ